MNEHEEVLLHLMSLENNTNALLAKVISKLDEEVKTLRSEVQSLKGQAVNKPRDEGNFLIEVTPEIKAEIDRIWMHSDEEPIAELHYSPYWKHMLRDKNEKQEGEE